MKTEVISGSTRLTVTLGRKFGSYSLSANVSTEAQSGAYKDFKPNGAYTASGCSGQILEYGRSI